MLSRSGISDSPRETPSYQESLSSHKRTRSSDQSVIKIHPLRHFYRSDKTFTVTSFYTLLLHLFVVVVQPLKIFCSTSSTHTGQLSPIRQLTAMTSESVVSLNSFYQTTATSHDHTPMVTSILTVTVFKALNQRDQRMSYANGRHVPLHQKSIRL